MSTFQERKAERKAHYDKFVHGWKLRKCTACNGSGYYDHRGSPPCGACEGTGKERYKPEPVVATLPDWMKSSPFDLDDGDNAWFHDPDMGAKG